jgi:formate dehydrogenase major subunit
VETDRTDIRLLDLLTAEGCAPPALCDDPRLKPAGDCRLCLVEVEGESHPAASCVVAAREGMVVRTNSERLIHFRRIILGWMAEKVSPEATARHPDKALHRLMKV